MLNKCFIEQAWDFVTSSLRRGVWILDPDGKILQANGTIVKWLESTELVGSESSQWMRGPFEIDDGSLEGDLVSKSGLVRKIEVLSHDLVDCNGTLTGRVQILTDQIMSRALGGRLVEEVRRMAKLAGEDALTGLANRRAFDDALATMQNELERKFGVVVIDLDDFKNVNDSFGHRVGDQVLKLYGEKLLILVRNDDLVARIGGDEFAVLLPGVNMVALTEAAERLRKDLVVELDVNGVALRVYASVGYAHSGPDPSNVVERADKWMYQNKLTREAAGISGLASQESNIVEPRT